jgi:hypothetical protein
LSSVHEFGQKGQDILIDAAHDDDGVLPSLQTLKDLKIEEKVETPRKTLLKNFWATL